MRNCVRPRQWFVSVDRLELLDSQVGARCLRATRSAFLRSELDRHRTKLRETQIERDRLRVELRDALSKLEYWRTLAEYRETMLDELRENTDRRRESPSPGHPAERPPRRLRRRA